MDLAALQMLEEAMEPYRQVGYQLVSQTDSAITLVGQARPFSYFGFVLGLLLCWPLAVLYLVMYNRARDTRVCLRVTAGGLIEASGYTLTAYEAERRHVRRIRLLVTAGVAVTVIIVVSLLTIRSSTRQSGQAPRPMNTSKGITHE
jgi:hypothetical protein